MDIHQESTPQHLDHFKLMKNFRLLLTVIFCLMLINSIIAQKVISTSGTTYNTNSYVVSFTLGECVINSHLNTALFLTQGFHQPFITDFNTYFESAINGLIMRVYPNPVSEILYLEVMAYKNIHYEIHDIKGQLNEYNLINEDLTQIDVSNLQPGTYFLSIGNNNGTIKTIQFVKE